MSQTSATVTVRQTNTFRALLDKLRAVRYGCYIVWIHNWEVARVAKVGQPKILDELALDDAPPADSEPKSPRSPRKARSPKSNDQGKQNKVSTDA